MYVRGNFSAAGFLRPTGSLKCPTGTRRKARQKPPLPFGFHQPLKRLAPVGRDQVEHGLTVVGHKRVQIDDVRDSLGAHDRRRP
jgi:hypothetical protein